MPATIETNKSGSKCTEGIYCTEQANKYRCSYRCIFWRCTSGYWRLDLTQTLSDIDWTARVCGDASFLSVFCDHTDSPTGTLQCTSCTCAPPGSGLKVVFKEGFITSERADLTLKHKFTALWKYLKPTFFLMTSRGRPFWLQKILLYRSDQSVVLNLINYKMMYFCKL